MNTYAIVFSSNTGNTEQLAKTIQRTLSDESCIYYGKPSQEAQVANRVYLGFWTDKGSADPSILDFIKALKNKEIFLFGTAGFGGHAEYFEQILERVRSNIDSSNTVIGSFMCQGKMPISVRNRYCALKAQGKDVDALIENYDQALSHPDAKDLELLTKAIAAV